MKPHDIDRVVLQASKSLIKTYNDENSIDKDQKLTREFIHGEA